MKISREKKDKISEQILAYLFSISPRSAFTSHIAQETARDEEFIKKILLELKKKTLITEVSKNPKGTPYIRRSRWCLSNSTYILYKSKQNSN